MTDTPTITIATLETRNFEFVATGRDEDHALRVLEAAWAQHAKQYGPRGVASWDTIRADYGIAIVTLPVGGATRDGGRII
jgi:hypothetical protein